MIEVHPWLYVGTAADYEAEVKDKTDWSTVHAAKEPYHREALGYTGRGAPKDHPEYLMARRGNRLMLNLVDVPDPAYVSREIVDAAIDFIREAFVRGHRVLVHCNQGESRAPTIALLYIAPFGGSAAAFEEAEIEFKEKYPSYKPGAGMRGFALQNWERYRLGSVA